MYLKKMIFGNFDQTLGPQNFSFGSENEIKQQNK